MIVRCIGMFFLSFSPPVIAADGKVNINTADLDTLTQLKGVGPGTAEKIIEYRKEFGKFKKLEDLLNVKGIGDKTLKKLKPFIKL